MHTKSILRKRQLHFGLWMLLAAFLYNCDMLESDVAPEPKDVEVINKQVFLLSNSTGIIDLNAVVKAPGSIRFDITSQPLKGTLTALGQGLIQYHPGAAFREGTDRFIFSVFDNKNTILKTDSVQIIIEDDTTALPCGFYAQNDSVYVADGPIHVAVLANDYICGDSTKLRVEIFRLDSSYPPYAGSASVVNNQIQYTRNSLFQGEDAVMYKIYNADDPQKISVATVYIKSAPQCMFKAFDDRFRLRLDSLIAVGRDSVELPILVNDSLCQYSAGQLTTTIISNNPKGHRINGADLTFRLPSPLVEHADTVVYRSCAGSNCVTAKVYVNVEDN